MHLHVQFYKYVGKSFIFKALREQNRKSLRIKCSREANLELWSHVERACDLNYFIKIIEVEFNYAMEIGQKTNHFT